MADKRKRLQEILLTRSFQYRESPTFKLASGVLSRYYFDCKKTTLDPEGAFLLGEMLYERTKTLPISGAGGLTLGGDPLGASLMHAAFRRGRRIHQFIVRKTLKQHGAVKWIEGGPPPGASVMVLDDVVTTGGSVIQAINRLREAGFDIYGVIVLLDREELNGMENIRRVLPGRPVEALFTRSEIMDCYRARYAEETL